MAQVALSSRRVANSSVRDGLARYGLAARAFVYVLIGWLGLQIARGNHSHQANQRGALAEVAKGGVGRVLLWVIGFGLGAYALWRLSCTVFGNSADGSGAGVRLKSAARGLVYLGVCISTFAFVTGASHRSQKRQQQTWTARVMHHSLGRWLVGAVGVVVVIIGGYLVVEGITRRFMEQLKLTEMSQRTRRVVVALGAVGSTARGIVFAVAGGLLVAAAVTFDAKKSSGLDGAMRTLAGRPAGPWLLSALAIGLIAFGAFGFAEARWERTR
jgi:hypothetical protein